MTSYSFTERAPFEAGFEQIFQRDIVPILKDHERRRKDLAKQATIGMGGAGVVGAGTTGGSALGGADFGIGLGLFVGVGGVLGLRGFFSQKYTSALAEQVLPILCEFFGDVTYGQQKINPGAFSQLGVVGSYHNASLEDPCSGTYRDISYALTEARLTRKSRDSKGRTKTTTVFRGLLIEIGLFNPAPHIYFAKDRGSIGNWFSETLGSARDGLTKFNVPHEEYEKIYETYAADVGAAQAFVTPQIVNGLLEIGQIHSSNPRYVSAAMKGTSFYVAIPLKRGFLQVGSLFKPLTDVEDDLHEALADLTLPKRVIDAFLGD
ncbi:MAG: DUF3137 domain-containing protein [Pseudomonadota bacterium]